MKDFRRISRAKVLGLLGKVQRYQLFLACMVIVLCFAIGNDVYAAKTVAQRHKDLLDGPRRVIDYSQVMRQKALQKALHNDTAPLYLVDAKSRNKSSLLSVLGGSETCAAANSFYPNPKVQALPYNDTGTTVGKTDNYDITGDPTACPSPTCEATSGTFPDRGYAYSGTGTGPDVAYRIQFSQPANIVITLDPSDAAPDADDLAVILYGSVCSSDPADAIVLADNSGSGNPPDLPDNSEFITVTNVPAGKYNIVIDGYTAAESLPNVTTGAYSLNITCVPAMTCVQPVPHAARREDL